MSHTIAQRNPLTHSLFAGLACAAALTLAAGPALAEPGGMERVEVRGRVVEAPARYDVRENCADIEAQLQSALTRTWEREGRYGEVKVQFLMENGEIGAVQAKGISNSVARDVRRAVDRLDCGPQATASAQIYSFNVDFVNPYAQPSDMRAATSGIRVALSK